MNEVALIGGMALVTFLVRYPLLALVGKVEMPKRIVESLRYVAPSVLAALVAPAIFLPGDQPIQDLTGLIPLVAITATLLVMWFSKNLTLTIIVGMAVYVGLRFVIH